MQLFTLLQVIHRMNSSILLHHLVLWMLRCQFHASESVSNADGYALQAFECLQEATAFVRQYTGKQMQRMKRYYDSSVRPVSYTEGEKVLVYNLRKQGGKFAKWQVCWRGRVVVQRKLNDSNYVLRKGKGKQLSFMWIACGNCQFHRMSNCLIHTRTLGIMNLLFHHASGVGHSLLQTCLAFTPRTVRAVSTGQIDSRVN